MVEMIDQEAMAGRQVEILHRLRYVLRQMLEMQQGEKSGIFVHLGAAPKCINRSLTQLACGEARRLVCYRASRWRLRPSNQVLAEAVEPWPARRHFETAYRSLRVPGV